MKGFPGESLAQVNLETDRGIPYDRAFAITHATSKYDEARPVWIHRRNFVTVARSPQLCLFSLDSNYDEHGKLKSLSLTNPRGETCVIDPTENAPQALPQHNFSSLFDKTQGGPHSVVQSSSFSLWDAPIATVSLFNLESLSALEQSIGVKLETARFRGNIWFSGSPAWEEFDWMGSELHITTQTQSLSEDPSGSNLTQLKLRVIDRVQRCKVINTNPANGQHDLLLTKHLRQTQGHNDFGVHAEVIASGNVGCGDTFEVAPGAMTDSQANPGPDLPF